MVFRQSAHVLFDQFPSGGSPRPGSVGLPGALSGSTAPSVLPAGCGRARSPSRSAPIHRCSLTFLHGLPPNPRFLLQMMSIRCCSKILYYLFSKMDTEGSRPLDYFLLWRDCADVILFFFFNFYCYSITVLHFLPIPPPHPSRTADVIQGPNQLAFRWADDPWATDRTTWAPWSKRGK